MEIIYDYSKEYNESSFWQKIKDFPKIARLQVIYAALILYYTLIEKTTPAKDKTFIILALGYFISPLDAIPDITPVLGFVDDYSIMVITFIEVSRLITSKITEKAKSKLPDWVDSIDDNDIEEVEKNFS